MNGFNLLHLRRSEPISIIVTIVSIAKSIIKASAEIVFRSRKVNDDIEGQCSTQLLIKQRHALIDFSALPKIVDEAIFNTDLRETNSTNDHYTEIDVQNLII